MNPLIGINPITWSNDDLQSVGGNLSVHTCLEDAANAGYQGIELGHKFPREPSALKDLLGEYGLDLVSGWYSGRLLQRDAGAEIEAMRAHADLLQAMDCTVLIFAEVTGCIHSDRAMRSSLRPRLAPGEWRPFARRLSTVARACADRGLKLCFHHHMGTVVQTAGEVDTLMNEVSDDVFLLLDSGHAAYAGDDPVVLARRHAGRIGHVHCKDVRERVLRACLNRDSSFLDAVLDGAFTVPGDGSVDFRGLFEVLDQAGYEGWTVVEAEQDPSVAPPRRFAQMGIDHLRGLVDRAA